MNQKTMVITGATSGIGLRMAHTLAESGAPLVLVARTPERGEEAAAAITATTGNRDIEVVGIDLGNRVAIRSGAAQIVKRHPRIDVLVNNAGLQSRQRRETSEGVELVWTTNVLAPFLLTNLLRPALEAAGNARIVTTASSFAGDLDLDDVEFRRRPYSAMASYRQSKQANRMWTWALAWRLKGTGVTANTFNPGLVRKTGLYRETPAPVRAILFFVGLRHGRTVEQGADTGSWLATSSDVQGISGRFYEQRREMPCEFRDETAEEKLWSLCERMTS